MAATAERGSKSKAVREYLASHEYNGPTAVVNALKEKGIEVTAALVSNIKNPPSKKKGKKGKTAKAQKRGRKPAVQSAPSANGTITLTSYQATRDFARSQGGYDQARHALAVAEKFEKSNS